MRRRPPEVRTSYTYKTPEPQRKRSAHIPVRPSDRHRHDERAGISAFLPGGGRSFRHAKAAAGVLWLAGSSLLLGFLLAATITPRAAESFRTFAEPAEIPERGTVLSQVVLAAGHKFTFLPPSGWALESNAEEKSLTLTAHDLGAVIRLQMTVEKPGVAAEKKEQWLQKVRERFPEGKILHQFTCYTGGSPGVAFDVERTFENKSKLATRLAFVPFPKGTIEFQLTAAPEKIRRYHFALNCLLTSLRVEPWPPAKQ